MLEVAFSGQSTYDDVEEGLALDCERNVLDNDRVRDDVVVTAIARNRGSGLLLLAVELRLLDLRDLWWRRTAVGRRKIAALRRGESAIGSLGGRGRVVVEPLLEAKKADA